MPRVLSLVLVLSANLIVTRPADAWISVYSDLQESFQDDSVVLTAIGSAELDDCQSTTVTVDVYLFDPTATIVASNATSDVCSASTWVDYSQSLDSFVDGEYEARATASGGGQFNGCSSVFKIISRYEGRYIYLGFDEYGKDLCEHHCQKDLVYLSYRGPYLWDRGIHINAGPIGFCRPNYQGSTQRGLCRPPG